MERALSPYADVIRPSERNVATAVNDLIEKQRVSTIVLADIGKLVPATQEELEAWLDKGLARVILGTVAVRDPDLVKEACRLFPGKIAVGIDAKGGKVAVEGWAEASKLGVIELAERFEGAGVAAIIYTDIDRDGVLSGINWEATIDLANAVSIPVIASGGLASIADIVRMTMPDAKRLEGAISGRALYDGRIDPAAALAVLGGAKPPAGLFEDPA